MIEDFPIEMLRKPFCLLGNQEDVTPSPSCIASRSPPLAIFGGTSAVRADGPASGEVTGVSVQPSPGRADVIINVRGAVEVRDFMLQGPNRPVVRRRGGLAKGYATSLYAHWG